MGWFEKLKKIIDVNINISNISLINITKNSNNQFDENGYFYESDKGILHLDIDKIPIELKKELKKDTKKY